MRRIEYFSSNDFETPTSDIEYFSIAEDLRLMKMKPRPKFTRINKDFSRFIMSKKSKLTQKDVDVLTELYTTKINQLIHECEPDILAGKTLDTLLGITDKDQKAVAIKFSKDYRKILITKNKLGYIPKNNQLNLNKIYKEFLTALQTKIFLPVLGNK